jgi:aminopeptidase YwaD
MNQYRQTLAAIWEAVSGDAAVQAVIDISRFHRIQASPGYRCAAQWLHRSLLRAGLEPEVLSYPAEEGVSFWTWPSFPEWDCSEATLHLVEPRSQAALLADYRACPLSLIQRSTSWDGEAEVVLVEGARDGEMEADYEGLDVAGKVVLSRGNVRRVSELAVQQRGAAGILFDGMRIVEPVRLEGDLVDERQYTAFWPDDDRARTFGFVLTPRQGQALRRLLRKGETVRVRARVLAEEYDGSLEVVSATIPGTAEQPSEILVVAHLCHPQPSANDNASGAAAALEAARALQGLVLSGALPRPQHTIRFLWMPEMTGTMAYLSGREAELGQMLAGLNLDMVGEDQDQAGSSWLIEYPPDAAASFAPELLAWLRDLLPGVQGMAGVSRSHTGLGGFVLYRQAEVPFSGGSDHLILSDPSVSVPTPMLIQWPDRFYHTSADTPERTDPDSMARAATLAAAYAYWLASAGEQEVSGLGFQMVARFKERIVEEARQAAAEALGSDDGDALATGLAALDRRLAYLVDRQQVALGSLPSLAPVLCLVEELQGQVAEVARQELAWARQAAGLRAVHLGLAGLPEPAARSLDATEEEAARLCPVRLVRGPVFLEKHEARLAPEERDAWRQRLAAAGNSSHHTLAALALFWADGERSVLDIAGQVEMEAGQRDTALLLHYFRLLEKLGFLELHPC